MRPGLVVTAPGDLEIVMTRSFDAPRDLVFEAMTKQEFLRRWLLGPDGWTMTVCEFDARPGGHYRYEWKHADGAAMGMGGTFLEVVPPERMVQREKFDEPWYPGEAIVTTNLQEVAGQTTLVVTLRYETKEARDGVLKSPMEGGVSASYDRLEAILREQFGSPAE
ncbi:SRPBCC family protein [Fimbriimonas ginsengisoli]|uniref:Glutathione s-transferase protein n=1 Tax=Fimbriimonas ginsengisoli Gsoil 348 TaxID=661478 RepID=A0A068NSK8_FIMGI|nr:SRPBCC family protein [Fimbriimonas ginsengisoli]AIE84564.1 glutathione s-transferase protein [Fimbriimonas ginsengisoli Gsoil 348]